MRVSTGSAQGVGTEDPRIFFSEGSIGFWKVLDEFYKSSRWFCKVVRQFVEQRFHLIFLSLALFSLSRFFKEVM